MRAFCSQDCDEDFMNGGYTWGSLPCSAGDFSFGLESHWYYRKQFESDAFATVLEGSLKGSREPARCLKRAPPHLLFISPVSFVFRLFCFETAESWNTETQLPLPPSGLKVCAPVHGHDRISWGLVIFASLYPVPALGTRIPSFLFYSARSQSHGNYSCTAQPPILVNGIG